MIGRAGGNLCPFVMATKVDICNLALSYLAVADIRSADLSDQTPQARQCAHWYPFAVRRLHEEDDWAFATKRTKLAPLAGVKHGFALPSSCVRTVRLDSADQQCLPYGIEAISETSRALICDAAGELTLWYVSDVQNAAFFPAYFIEPLWILLASMLIGPLKRSDSSTKTVTSLLQLYQASLSRAKAANAREGVALPKLPKRAIPSAVLSRVI